MARHTFHPDDRRLDPRRLGLRRPLAAVLLAALVTGCGSGDDDEPGGAVADDAAASGAADGSDAADGAGDDSAEGDVFIRDGSGTIEITLPDGRTETRDVACAVYRDRFEVTVEYSDILESDQSVTFYYRETDDSTDVNFVFQDPELGGVMARVPDAISAASLDGTDFSAQLEPLLVQTAEPAGAVGVSGTCSES